MAPSEAGNVVHTMYPTVGIHPKKHAKQYLLAVLNMQGKQLLVNIKKY